MATFLRLLGFLRPYRRGVVLSGALAACAMAMTAAIPWLTGRAIDQMREGDRSGLRVLALAVLGAGVLRITLTVARRLISMLQSGLTILLAAAAMFATRPGLAAISLAPVPFVIAIAARYGRRSRPALQEVQQRIAELTADVEENVGGVRVVKAFAREDRQLDRFRGQVGRVFDQSMVTTRMAAFYNPFIGFLPQVGLAAILFYGGRQVIRGELTIGQFSAFYAYLLMLLSPMRTLGISLGMAQRATASGARLFQILARAPGIVSRPGAPPLPAGNGHVELRGASLRYEGTARPALHDVDLDVPAGTTVALVGATGSGKTTLVQLIPRLYDVTARLPEGYATRVGERGLTLSGGQRQRIAVARAFLADPRILILDDATSSIDASTEQEIKTALREVMAGRTTFVIAHRLSTISLADEIVVLEDGALLAHGTHDELLEASELYREIVEKGLPDQVFLTQKPRERKVAGLV